MVEIIGVRFKSGGKQYYFDGKFKGADLAETAIPQNYGITTLEELGIFYNQ